MTDDSNPTPPFSLTTHLRTRFRSFLFSLLGGVVGALLGLILFIVLTTLYRPSGVSFLPSIWAAGGFLLGYLFHPPLVRLLYRSSRKGQEERPIAQDRPSADAAPDGVRELVETVVFIFVLVLTLKAFDAEAFVIPTGSMAETLLGYQKWIVCPACGYRFPANCSQQVDPSDGTAHWVSGCTCPNCRQHIHFVPRGQGGAGGAASLDEIADPEWGDGDHVLVSRFAYDLLERLPDRLDVVVFKFPGNGNLEDHNPRNPPFPRTGPFKDGAPMNYIKRLVGLPGETIAIHDGDLYVLAPDRGLQYDDLQGATDPARRDDLARQLWQTRFLHNNDPEAMRRFQRGEFQIIRKPPETLLAMRRIVYDNDHPAKDLHAARWSDRDGGAWKADDAHGFRLAAKDGKAHWLGYQHLLRGQEDKPQLITDFMGYNAAEPRNSPSGVNWVGDLILECEVQPDQARGELTLELSKGVDRFRARFDLASGVCTLLRVHDAGSRDEKEEELDHKPTTLKGGGKHTVRFADVDQRLTVWVDDALPFGDGTAYLPPSTEGPTEANDLKPAGVGLKGVEGTIHGLRLWRDTYYSTAEFDQYGAPGLNGEPSAEADPAYPDAGSGVNFADPSNWGKLRHLPTRTLYVQPAHFLCLGDNSPQSSDGRLWGLVPERLLLGKAIDIYYPFDRFGKIR